MLLEDLVASLFHRHLLRDFLRHYFQILTLDYNLSLLRCLLHFLRSRLDSSSDNLLLQSSTIQNK